MKNKEPKLHAPKLSFDGIEKPKSIKQLPSYIGKKIKYFFTHFFYTISLVWEAAPKMLIFMISCCIFDGIFPVFNAYISREMLNEISALLAERPTNDGSLEGIVLVFKPVILLFGLQFLYWFLRSILSRLNITSTALASELVSNHIKLKIMNKAKTVDQSSFDRTEFYEKLENANREAGTRPLGILSATFTIVSAGISVVSFIVILAGLNPWAALIMILATMPGAFVNYYFKNKSFRYMRHKSKERRQMNYYSGLMVNKDYAKEIKILGLSDTVVKKYEDVFDNYYRGIKRIIIKEGIVRVLVGLIITVANCGLFAYVAYSIVFGSSSQIGDYSLYTNALISVANYFSSIIGATATIYEGTLFIDNMITFMNEEPKVVASIPEPHKIERGAHHRLELRNVSFAYPGTDEPVLKNVNLTFESGESSVIVGLNGAGKTTLIKLICRLYDATEGEILFDGKPLTEYDPKEYYELFGIIFQDFGKYSETVSENIRYGDISREHSMDEITDSALSAGADGFITELPDGYDTPLTRVFEDNGIELSGGQWQKLSVARAFYKDSDILIMDEPTASLDAIAEQEIFRRFEKLSEGKISIFISHRLSSATAADKIIVLKEGRVVEMGSHRDLMEAGGDYHKLFTTQAERYRDDPMTE